ncbi:ParD-like family protein [Synechococcus sp. CS-1328]|nr:ParD-like family protein [Synechococcus sp. CS-1328]
MESAARIGARHHRSAAEQIEYWAALGRQVARVLDPDTLLDVAAGLTRLRPEPVVAPMVSPEQVFAAVEADRQSGALQQIVSSAAFRYQASITQPGSLEQITPDGTRIVGLFRHGLFQPIDTEPSTDSAP